MTAVQECVLVASREVRRNLKSAKGLVLVALCVLGAVIAALVMAWVQKLDLTAAASQQITPEQMRAFQEMALAKKYGDAAMGKYLAQAPFVLLAATLAGVWLAPLLVSLVGFDSIPTDLQHSAVRYFTVRVRRASYYVGKLVGLWIVVCTMMLFTHAVIWGVALARGSATVTEIATWGPRFWFVMVPIMAAWSGVAQLVASQFRVPILALLVTFATFFVLFIVYAVGELSTALHWLIYLYPNAYDAWLLSPHVEKVALGTLVCLGISVATGAAGAASFSRRDL